MAPVEHAEDAGLIDVPVYAVLFRPDYFSSHSGLFPLARELGAVAVPHAIRWQQISQWSWRLGHGVRRFGQWYFGSEWNGLFPVLDEWRIARRTRSVSPRIIHFLFAEFAGPRWVAPFRRSGASVIGTFHASRRRQERVCGRMPLHVYDAITYVCRAQEPFFLSQGVEKEKLFLTLHGVDINYFRPDPMRDDPREERVMKGLLVGATERDHNFAASLMRALPAGTLELSVAARPYPHPAYAGVPGVTLLPALSDLELLKAYQAADLLVMPLMDATANNAILEAMACGTPVLTNRCGGTADYVDDHCNFVMEGRNLDEWREQLLELATHRTLLSACRMPVRKWAETFAWEAVAGQYRSVYRAVLRQVS